MCLIINLISLIDKKCIFSVSSSVHFSRLLFFLKIFHFIQVVKLVGIKMFMVFHHYPFNAMGSVMILPFLLLILLMCALFPLINLYRELAIFVDLFILLIFFVFYFIDLCSSFSYFLTRTSFGFTLPTFFFLLSEETCV